MRGYVRVCAVATPQCDGAVLQWSERCRGVKIEDLTMLRNDCPRGPATVSLHFWKQSAD